MIRLLICLTIASVLAMVVTTVTHPTLFEAFIIGTVFGLPAGSIAAAWDHAARHSRYR